MSTPLATEPRKCLLVDDLKGNLLALESLLRPEGAVIFRAQSGEEALELLLEHDFALALVDVQMPGMSGYELAEFMRGSERTRHIPIIFVTAGSRVQEGVFKGYEAGAVDFLFKPLDPFVVRSKVRIFLELDAQRARLLQTESELKRALAGRDEFFSIASHELKTPITAINLQLQILGKIFQQLPENPSRDRIHKAFGTFNRQVTKLNDLVDSLLDVTRIKNGKLNLDRQPTDLGAIVKDAVERLAASEKHSTVELDCESVHGSWDPQRLEQVAVNLISNAFKYGGGGLVRVSVRRSAEGQEAVLQVQDEGSGIPSERLPYIFDRFERAVENSSVQGLGLGLYIVKQIVQAHGGTVNVTSETGKGTSFTVSLPATGA